MSEIECDHGVTFDEYEAQRIMATTKESSSGDAAIDFIVGPVNAVAIIRERWPRLFGACPKGCGFNGISYASYAHYVYGDW